MSVNHHYYSRFIGFITILSLVFSITTGCSTQKTLRKWQSKPDINGKVVAINNATLFYKIKGSGDKLVIIETGFGTLYSKWIPLQDSLAKYAKVLIYDRGDYGYSTTNNYPRTPDQISNELNELLIKEHLDANQIYLLGHSFGANQIIHDALKIKNVKGLLLLDPAPYDLKSFVTEIKHNPDLDGKTKKFAINTLSGKGGSSIQKAGTIGLIFWLYKMQGGNEKDSNYSVVLNTASKNYYKAMNSESENEVIDFTDKQKEQIANIPMVLITANWFEIAKTISKSYKLKQNSSELLMKLFNEEQKQYLNLSNQSIFKPATTSEHDIYRFEPQIVINSMLELMK